MLVTLDASGLTALDNVDAVEGPSGDENPALEKSFADKLWSAKGAVDDMVVVASVLQDSSMSLTLLIVGDVLGHCGWKVDLMSAKGTCLPTSTSSVSLQSIIYVS